MISRIQTIVQSEIYRVIVFISPIQMFIIIFFTKTPSNNNLCNLIQFKLSLLQSLMDIVNASMLRDII